MRMRVLTMMHRSGLNVRHTGHTYTCTHIHIMMLTLTHRSGLNVRHTRHTYTCTNMHIMMLTFTHRIGLNIWHTRHTYTCTRIHIMMLTLNHRSGLNVRHTRPDRTAKTRAHWPYINQHSPTQRGAGHGSLRTQTPPNFPQQIIHRKRQHGSKSCRGSDRGGQIWRESHRGG